SPHPLFENPRLLYERKVAHRNPLASSTLRPLCPSVDAKQLSKMPCVDCGKNSMPLLRRIQVYEREHAISARASHRFRATRVPLQPDDHRRRYAPHPLGSRQLSEHRAPTRETTIEKCRTERSMHLTSQPSLLGINRLD